MSQPIINMQGKLPHPSIANDMPPALFGCSDGASQCRSHVDDEVSHLRQEIRSALRGLHFTLDELKHDCKEHTRLLRQQCWSGGKQDSTIEHPSLVQADSKQSNGAALLEADSNRQSYGSSFPEHSADFPVVKFASIEEEIDIEPVPSLSPGSPLQRLGTSKVVQTRMSTGSQESSSDRLGTKELQAIDDKVRHALQDTINKDSGLKYSKPEIRHDELDKLPYDVTNLYHDSGIAQAVARSELFSNLTLAVIIFNAVYIGYEADKNDAESLATAEIQFVICENVFCAFFTFEWIVRFCAFAKKLDCLKDIWFKFDSILVVMMVFETWVLPLFIRGVASGGEMGMLKMLRLLRLARMTRLAREFPELVAMCKGVRVASRAVGSAWMMLILAVYVFAVIIFMQLGESTDETIQSRFRSLGHCMWTLMIDGVFLDNIGYISRAIIDEDRYDALAVLVLFVLASAMTVMNMLIGVLCEVVTQVSAAEKEDFDIKLIRSTLLVFLLALDKDGSGSLSQDELLDVFDDPDALVVLDRIRVDQRGLLEHLEMAYDSSEDDELPIHEIMQIIIMLRGDRTPTVADVAHQTAYLRWKVADIVAAVARLEERFDTKPKPKPRPLERRKSTGLRETLAKLAFHRSNAFASGPAKTQLDLS